MISIPRPNMVQYIKWSYVIYQMNLLFPQGQKKKIIKPAPTSNKLQYILLDILN
jgi:hypothetical protein